VYSRSAQGSQGEIAGTSVESPFGRRLEMRVGVGERVRDREMRQRSSATTMEDWTVRLAVASCTRGPTGCVASKTAFAYCAAVWGRSAVVNLEAIFIQLVMVSGLIDAENRAVWIG